MQRKVFGAEFKAKVALEALAGRKTAKDLAENNFPGLCLRTKVIY